MQSQREISRLDLRRRVDRPPHGASGRTFTRTRRTFPGVPHGAAPLRVFGLLGVLGQLGSVRPTLAFSLRARLVVTTANNGPKTTRGPASQGHCVNHWVLAQHPLGSL